jgi:hypothetical protein
VHLRGRRLDFLLRAREFSLRRVLREFDSLQVFVSAFRIRAPTCGLVQALRPANRPQQNLPIRAPALHALVLET